MKKLVLTAAIVLGMVSANSQEVKFGAKAGLNIASVYFSEMDSDFKDNLSPVYSFHAGGFAEINLSEQLAIQPELIYSVQGIRIKEDVLDMPDASDISDAIDDIANGSIPDIKPKKVESVQSMKIHYLNIPVMVKYYVMDALALEVGPQIGFLINTTVTTKIDGDKVEYSDKEQEDMDKEIKDGLKTTDFGMNFGASYNVTDNLSLGARYNLGLTDMAKKREDNDKGTDKNGVIQVSLGFSF